MKQLMKVYEEKCDKSDLMCNINKKQESVLNPSYSMIHALEYGFRIMIYSGNHDTNMFNDYIHIKHAVRWILNNGMGVMWHESLYHSGAKSRQSPSELVKDDLILFMYLWTFIVNNQRNRNVGTTNGVAREYGWYLHWDKLDKYMCKDFYDDSCKCPQCI